MARKLRWTTHADLAVAMNPVPVGREEYLDYMTFQRNDRPLFTEIFGPMIGLKEKWADQGATEAELNLSTFKYRCESRGYLPVNTGCNGGFPEEVLEDTPECKVYRDGFGRTQKLCKGFATISLPQDFPVATMDDWLKFKPWFRFSEDRLAGDWRAAAADHRQNDRIVCVGIPGGYDVCRDLLGDEGACVAYYEQPELIHDILDTLTDTAYRVLETVSAEAPIDLLSVHEDMAGKSGPLAGPSQIEEFIGPYYRRIWDLLSDRGARLFEQDSDGDINPILDAFTDAGLNCTLPVEPAANMDIVKLREKYGRRLAFYGGLDKHVLRGSREEILAELEYKIPPMVAGGGCVLALDHRIPNGTPLANYRFYIRSAWEILDREAAKL